MMIPFSAVAAPVPTHLMARPEIQLRYNSATHPLGSTYEITIRNTGGADLQVWTDRLYGLATFVDTEIRNDKDVRISRPYRWNSPANRDAALKLVETIPPGKSYSTTLPAFSSVNDKDLIPGKYRVRVRFKYQDHDVVSDWVTVEVSEFQIRTKHIELGP